MKVSVVMATYNRHKIIGKAIKSVLNQTHQDWELIVTDDGSTDKTEKKVKRFKDPRITYINEGKSAYYTVNRNRGIDRAKGQLLAFHDDDVLWEPTFLEEMIKPFSNLEVMMAYCYRFIHDGEEIKVKPQDLPVAFRHVYKPFFNSDSVANIIDVNEMVVRNNGIRFTEEIDNPGYCSDLKMVDEIVKKNRHGKVVSVPKRLVHYFLDHGGGINNMTLRKLEHREKHGKLDESLEKVWSF